MDERIGYLLYCIASVLMFLGALFLMAAPVQNTVPRLITGGILVVVSLAMIVITRMKTKAVYEVKATVELPAKIDLSQLKCKECGGKLTKESLHFDPNTGTITVSCPYCGAVYQMVEDVKW